MPSTKRKPSKASSELTRNFKIVKSTLKFPKEGGRYEGDPEQAAKKAASRMFRKSSEKTVTFTIAERTRGSNHKEFTYRAKKVMYPEPVVRTIKGKEIVYTYEIEIHAVK